MLRLELILRFFDSLNRIQKLHCLSHWKHTIFYQLGLGTMR